MKETYDEKSLSCEYVFEWYKWFSEGRESTEDDHCPDWPALFQLCKQWPKSMKLLCTEIDVWAFGFDYTNTNM